MYSLRYIDYSVTTRFVEFELELRLENKLESKLEGVKKGKHVIDVELVYLNTKGNSFEYSIRFKD